MLQKNNKWSVLKVFFEDPSPNARFQLREISKKIHLAPISVKNYLTELDKEDLIVKIKHRAHNYPLYSANRENELFRLLKKINTILCLRNSGLLAYINDLCMPEVIILFGSAAKGEDILESDIDLFIQCKEKKMMLKKYEQRCKRNINLFFAEDFDKLSKEFKNNIINGVILKGYLKVF